MTVQANYNPITYIGDGSQTEFFVDFYIFNPQEVRLGKLDLYGVTELVYGLDYKVNVNPSGLGATVIYKAAVGEKFVLWLDTAIEQGLDLVQSGKLPAQRLEEGLDRLTLIAQQANEILSRAVKVPVGSELTPEDLVEDIFKARDDAVFSRNMQIAVDDAPYGHQSSASYNPNSNMLTLFIPEGKQGQQGIEGAQGIQGEQGIQGIQGICGIQGIQGVQGERGVQGVQGEKGLQGDIGVQGLKGDRGEIGATGYAPAIDVIDCGGAIETQLVIIDAGNASSFI